MFILRGKYNTARVHTDNFDEAAISQVIELLNQPFCAGSQIEIMPDGHAGAGCVVGTTMTIKDKIVPNLVGVDLGCGMLVLELDIENLKEKDFRALDSTIHSKVPSGFSTRIFPHYLAESIQLDKIIAPINLVRAQNSIGTLGGGNHFIELNKDDEGRYYLVIHTGSRNLGKQVAEYWQNVAIETLKSEYRERVEIMLKIARDTNQTHNIQEKKALIAKPPADALCYLEGENMRGYLEDSAICNSFANANRWAIAQEILSAMGWSYVTCFETVHNYINLSDMVLRKGSISAKYAERVIIPINMRDGSIIAQGLGNDEWNQSAPHGAGRLMSRGKAKEMISIEEFKKSMSGIYSTSVSTSTIDESPMAYKSMEEIIENIKETVKIERIIKPVYNFKAGGE